MFWILLLIRIFSYVFSWVFIIVSAILKDSKETRQKAKEVREIWGAKRVNLLNAYMLLLLPEFIVLCLIWEDLKIIIKGEDFK